MELSWYALGLAHIHAALFIGIFYAVRELLEKEKGRPLNPHVYWAMVDIAIHSRIVLLLVYDLRDPRLFLGIVAMIYMIGVIHYLLIRNLFVPKGERKSSWIIHTLPAVVLFGFEVMFFHRAQIPLLNPEYTSYGPIALAFMGVAGLANAIYLAATLRIFFAGKERYQLAYNHYLYFYAIAPAALAVFALSLTFIVNPNQVIYALALVVSCFPYVALHLTIKYPGFFDALELEIDQKRYEKTQLTGIDVGQFRKKLDATMLDQELFKDDELRLQDLAATMGVTSNQLSRIINEEYGKNFYQFLNHYRIEEAKRLLTSTAMSALEVAYAVGYSSKSGFYKNFSAATGMTPLQYKKRSAA